MDLEFFMSLVSFFWSVFQMAERFLKKKRPETFAKKKRKAKKRNKNS